MKKALLLCLVGGVTRHLKDGMKIRGDVHLCLMGTCHTITAVMIHNILLICGNVMWLVYDMDSLADHATQCACCMRDVWGLNLDRVQGIEQGFLF